MKPLPPEVSLGQLLDLIKGKKPKPVPRSKRKKPLNEFWELKTPDQSKVRHFRTEQEWLDYLAATPRDNSRLFKWMKQNQRLQEAYKRVELKREVGRKKHLKRHA